MGSRNVHIETAEVRAQQHPAGSLATQPAAGAMKPKEHGAYAILVIPLITSLVGWGASWAGVCVAVAAAAGFLAHEPLLIALGNRGARVQRNTPGATRRMLVLVSIAFAFGLTALALGNASGRLSLIVCLLLAVVSMLVSTLSWHRTYVGQLLGVASLSAPGLAIAVSSGQTFAAGLEMWSGWWIGFAATTTGVRSVIAAQKQHPRMTYTIVMTTLSMVTVIAVLGRSYWPLAVVPMILASWYLHFAPPPVRHIRRIGWILVAVTSLSAAVMIVLARTA